MRFLVMHKNDSRTEAGELPPMSLVQEMGAFIGEFAATGRFLDGAGLARSATRTRMVFRDGEATVTHGPYAGNHELPAALLLLEVPSRDVAIGWAERYGRILGNGEIELGKVTEPWDLGVAPVPPNPPLHILLVEKADPDTEGAGRSPAKKAELTRLETEMKKAGVLLRSTRLQKSANAKRLVFRKNEARIVDGPFAESKELIGGFAMLELEGFDEAVSMCRRYAAILGGDLEIDLRLAEVD